MNVVSTLPLSPRSDPNLGFYTIPVVADILGSASGSKTIQAVNLVGSKVGATKNLQDHLHALRALRVSTDMLWIDSEHTGMLSGALEEIQARGSLTREFLGVWLCPCGKTELPEFAESLLQPEFHGSTYELDFGVPRCRLCGSHAKLTRRWRLLLHLPEIGVLPAVQPPYATQEIAALWKQFSGRKLSVSRERQTGLQFGIGESQFQLDPDVVWMLFPALAGLKWRCSIRTLLTGHKTLKHALTSALASRLLTAQFPEMIISLPYVILGDKQLAPGAKALINERQATTLRCLLAQSIGGKRKELTLQLASIYWIEHSLRVSTDTWSDSSPMDDMHLAQELWRTFSRQCMNNLLAKLRSQQQHRLSNIEKLLLRGIFSGTVPRPS